MAASTVTPKVDVVPPEYVKERGARDVLAWLQNEERSVAWLARKVGSPYERLRSILNRRRPCPLPLARAIAAITGMRPDRLVASAADTRELWVTVTVGPSDDALGKQVPDVTVRALLRPRATTLYLPQSSVACLGLRERDDVSVETPDGIVVMRQFDQVRVAFEDRNAWIQGIAVPDGWPAVLGMIPMGQLGIEADFETLEVRRLTDYIRA